MSDNSGTGWRLTTKAVTSGLPLFATLTMINLPPLETLGLISPSELPNKLGCVCVVVYVMKTIDSR